MSTPKLHYRHGRADAQIPVGNIGPDKIGGVLDVRMVVDESRGKHRNCTCCFSDPRNHVHRDCRSFGCPRHGDASDEVTS